MILNPQALWFRSRSEEHADPPLSPGPPAAEGKDSGDGGKLGRAEHLFHCPAAKMACSLGQVLETVQGFTCLGFFCVTHYIRCECLELVLKERLAAPANTPRSSALLGGLWQLQQELCGSSSPL